MRLGDDRATFGVVSLINHWVIASAAIVMLAVGVALAGMDQGEDRSRLLALHKASGVLILALALWRVAWRLVQGMPAGAEAHPAWQNRAAFAMHWFLMIALVAMPLSGLLWSLFAGRPVAVFGLLTIPALPESEAAAKFFQTTHRLLSKGLIAAVVVHALAGIYHAATDTGKTAGRMFGVK